MVTILRHTKTLKMTVMWWQERVMAMSGGLLDEMVEGKDSPPSKLSPTAQFRGW